VDQTPKINSALFDVSTMSIEELLLATEDDPNMAATLARLHKSLDDPDGIISAFQSFASTD
jgi:hypothetical protein